MRSGVRLSPSRSGFSPSSDSSRRTKVSSSRFDTSDISSSTGAVRVSRRGSPRVFCSIALSGLVNAPLRMIDMSQADGVGSIYQSATPNMYCRHTFTCARCAAACTRGHGRRYHALYGRNLPLSVMTTRSPGGGAGGGGAGGGAGARGGPAPGGAGGGAGGGAPGTGGGAEERE